MKKVNKIHSERHRGLHPVFKQRDQEGDFDDANGLVQRRVEYQIPTDHISLIEDILTS